MKPRAELNLKPGTYLLSVEQEKIRFRVGSREYLIHQGHLMKNPLAPFDCLEEGFPNGRIFPLKQCPANRFTLGKYGETEIVVHFNHVQVIRRNG